MFENKSGTADDYHELNAGAHRKPPKVLTAPSLIWNLCFWTNFQEYDAAGKPLKDPDGSPKKKTRDEIKTTLDKYIIALRGAIENSGDQETNKVELTPFISKKYLLFGHSYGEDFRRCNLKDLDRRQKDIFEGTSRTVSLRFAWKELDVTIRFEIHTEYFSISTFVELDKDRKKQGVYLDKGLERSIGEIREYLRHPPLSPLRDDAVDRSLTPPPVVAEGSPPSSLFALQQLRVRKINQYCFHDFWKRYEQELLCGKVLTEITKDAIFGQIFADFRGLVASEQDVTFDDRPFFKDDRSPKWGADAKGKFLPLIEHRNRDLRIRYECAVNYMLDGRALYISTLGPQFPASAGPDSGALSPGQDGAPNPVKLDDKRIPVEFIVYAHQRYDDTTIVNKWQLGRLINQILLLDTLRLCALKEVNFLNDAGQQLGMLDDYTQKARDAIASAEAKPGKKKRDEASQHARSGIPRDGTGVEAERRASDDDDVIDLIGRAHQKLNEITGKFLKDTGGGLLFRIERSRFYVKQFEENVKLLRIRRLEGDQPYDQFIRRRLGWEFDFIDRLGIRYERATRNVVSLDQNYLAITQNALVKQANQIDEDIHAIQKYGELFLLGALVPYYVTHLFIMIFGEELAPVIAGNVWVVFAVFAIANFFKILEKTWKLIPLLDVIAFALSRIGRKISEYLPQFGIAVFALVVVLAIALGGQPYEAWLWQKQHKNQEESLSETSKRILEAQRRLKESVDRGVAVVEKSIKVQQQPGAPVFEPEPAVKPVPPDAAPASDSNKPDKE